MAIGDDARVVKIGQVYVADSLLIGLAQPGSRLDKEAALSDSARANKRH